MPWEARRWMAKVNVCLYRAVVIVYSPAGGIHRSSGSWRMVMAPTAVPVPGGSLRNYTLAGSDLKKSTRENSRVLMPFHSWLGR